MPAPACRTCGEPLVELGHDVETTLVGCGGTHLCGGEHARNCVGRLAWCSAGHRNKLGLRRRCNDHEPERSWGYDDIGDSSPLCDWRGPESCRVCGPDVIVVDAWPELPVRTAEQWYLAWQAGELAREVVVVVEV